MLHFLGWQQRLSGGSCCSIFFLEKKSMQPTPPKKMHAIYALKSTQVTPFSTLNLRFPPTELVLKP